MKNENTQKPFASFFSNIGLYKLLKASNCRKQKGTSPSEIFSYLFQMVFRGSSIYLDNSMDRNCSIRKDTVYRFLNNVSINWIKFTTLAAIRIISSIIRPLNIDEDGNHNDEEVFIIDDSTYERKRSKKVSMLAKVYDHANGKFTKGFRMLTLGWSDGRSFIPVNFLMLSSRNDKNRMNDNTDKEDSRTCSHKRKMLSKKKGTEVMFTLLEKARKYGLSARYVLFDSWFTSPDSLIRIKKLGMDTIAMIKKSDKMTFRYRNRKRSLREIYTMKKHRPGKSKWLMSVTATAEKDDSSEKVKIVYVRNRENNGEYLCLITTDINLSEDEIIRIYGKRWSIECFFKICKSNLNLVKECRSLSYDAVTAHTAVVFARYMMLSVEERLSKDQRSFGQLFYSSCKIMDDITFEESYELLTSTMIDIIKETFSIDDAKIRELTDAFLDMLPEHLRLRLPDAA